jgi:RHS repeat-associated protein
MPVAVITPAAAYYVFADHLNAPIALALPDVGTVWDWRGHDPFGNGQVVTGKSGSADTGGAVWHPNYELRFPGQVADSATGLFYNYFRDYDPQTGRYIESDPVGLGGGINTYGYVAADPLRYADPTGQCIEDFCVGEVIAGATWCATNPACAAGVVAITGGAIFSQSTKQARKESHDAYKAFQRQGYQRDPNDPCQELRNKIEFHEKLIAARSAHDAAFPNPGWPDGKRHADVNARDDENVKRWKKELEECEKSCKR